ncbi:MAG: hypothetical protein KBT77_04850, partial [Thalassolituus oleivorans]|uniref:hypothetical protein n=1 Tax=Thalassolituus oleivorans TaxID=187493 RepID=UPI001B5BAFAA
NCNPHSANDYYIPPDPNSTEDNENYVIYWEPEDWSLGLSTDVTVTYDFNGATVTSQIGGVEITVPVADRDEDFRIVNREIGPVLPPLSPMQGSDVKMLESMLWQLGISPQKGNPGSEGARINSIRYGTTKTASCVSGEFQRRDTYSSYANIDKCAATELMVKRFNARNLDTGTAVTPAEAEGARGTVDTSTLTWLKRDWVSYMETYRDLSVYPIFDRDSGDTPSWIGEAVNIWRDGTGNRVPPTLTDTVYNRILEDAGMANGERTQAQLLTAWLEEESRYHWGSNTKGYQATDYRMNEGGADENGSLSYSQLLYHYRYGPNPCAAHLEANLNLYHPRDNLKTLVIHTASDNSSTSATQNCEGGLHKAFVRNTLKSSYNQAAAGETLEELRGFIHPQQEVVTTVQVTDQEDDYEALAKAIGIYNSNGTTDRPIFTSRSWAGRLRYLEYLESSTENTATVCHSCKYTLLVRNKAETFAGHLRKYIWQGGTGLDLDNDGVIATVPNNDGIVESETPWCFGYGEEEWLSGVTYAQVRQNASDTDVDGAPQTPVGRLTCN